MGAVALALDGEITTYGPQGHRIVRSEDFFLGLFTNSPWARRARHRAPIAARRP